MSSEALQYEVHKFGGDAMADEDRIIKNASEIARLVKNGSRRVVVVVSAQGDTTNDLLKKARKIRAEARLGDSGVDMLASAGETASAGLMAIALEEAGVSDALCFTPQQLTMKAEVSQASPYAMVTQIDGGKLVDDLRETRVISAPGFLATNPKGKLHTLGRGGSDLSAIAIAASLNQATGQRVPVYFHKKPEGVKMVDPDLVPDARVIRHMSYADCRRLIQASSHQFIAGRGAAVADRLKVPMHFIQAASLVKPGQERDMLGTIIGAQNTGNIEEEPDDFRALASRSFWRRDMKFTDFPEIIGVLGEGRIAFEECKPSRDGGYELLLPKFDDDDAAEQARDEKLKELPLSPRKPVEVFHYMDSRILNAEDQLFAQVVDALRSEIIQGVARVSTESDAIIIECEPDVDKLVARTLADAFELRVPREAS